MDLSSDVIPNTAKEITDIAVVGIAPTHWTGVTWAFSHERGPEYNGH